MRGSKSAMCFSGSRAKLIPQAIVLMALILFLGLFWVGSAVGLGQGNSPLGALAALALATVIMAFIIWIEVRTLRRIANPDLLKLTPTGIDLTTAGERRFYAWAALGEPIMQRLSGRSAAQSIIMPLHGGGQIVLPAEEFAHGAADILLALEHAKAGVPMTAPPPPSQALYLYLAIPASIVVLGIVLGGVITVLF